MRKANLRALVLTALVALLSLSLSVAAFAQTEQPGAPSEADMQKMMEMTQPGPQHAQMNKLVGKWKAMGKMWMDPAMPAMESEGVMEYMPVLGGRYFHGRYQTMFMGQPFEGLALDGYDRYANEYFSYWFDTMGTGVMGLRGTASADGKTITLKGSSYDPMVQGVVQIRTVSKWVSDDTINYEMYQMKGDKDVKVMEIVYTRM